MYSFYFFLSTDLFIIVGNDTETRVNVFLWNVQGWEFVNSSTEVAYPYITNIAAGDFNYDGKLDLMISGKNITTNNTYLKDLIIVALFLFLPFLYIFLFLFFQSLFGKFNSK